MLTAINDYISYIPSSDKPVSSDVGVVYGKECTYIFDVGSTYECLEFLNLIEGKKKAVVSHFHADHTWWLTEHKKGEPGMLPGDELSLNYVRPDFESIYVGKGTEKYVSGSTVITEPFRITDMTRDGRELKIDIIPMPSSHSKGSLAMMVNDEYIFMGDSTYCRYREPEEGREETAEYNVQKLKSQIELLKELKGDKCLISHESRFIRPKKVILRQLEAMFEKRMPGDNTISFKKS